MNNLVPSEHQNQIIISTKQIMEAYETDVKVIANNFNRNKNRYIESKHYYCLEDEDLKGFKTNHQIDVPSRHYLTY